MYCFLCVECNIDIMMCPSRHQRYWSDVVLVIWGTGVSRKMDWRPRPVRSPSGWRKVSTDMFLLIDTRKGNWPIKLGTEIHCYRKIIGAISWARFTLDNERYECVTVCVRVYSLHCTLSCAMYCNWSCLFVCVFVCGSVTTITRNCVYRSSPNLVCRWR